MACVNSGVVNAKPDRGLFILMDHRPWRGGLVSPQSSHPAPRGRVLGLSPATQALSPSSSFLSVTERCQLLSAPPWLCWDTAENHRQCISGAGAWHLTLRKPPALMESHCSRC